MTKFRPCIDLHRGQVKQIVGATLRDDEQLPQENFVASETSQWFAEKYREHDLRGGHVIKLGPGNDEAAITALGAFPGGLQVGGSITDAKAQQWLDAGASHVIVTSWLFDDAAKFQMKRLERLAREIGRENIVVDLSCKRTTDGWTVAMNRWQTLTDLNIDSATLDRLAEHCNEFLIHAADVEGLCNGIERELVEIMGDWGKIPMTYAGGVANMQDVELVASSSNGKVDVTVGSALDLFGGTGIKFEELVTWNQR